MDPLTKPLGMRRTESPDLLTGATHEENLTIARLTTEAQNANTAGLRAQLLRDIEELKKTILDRQPK